jgi:lysophospholipase L1-like esterase
MGRRPLVVVVAAVLVALVGCGALVLAGTGGDGRNAGSASRASATPPVTSSTPEQDAGIAWYLALGDSLAAGYQPTNPGDRTDREGGYAGLVRDGVARAQPDRPAPELVNLACPGETTATLADGGRCTYPEGSQLAAALAAVRGRGGRPGLITLQVGANDVQRCVTFAGGAPGVDEACVTDGLETVRTRLPEVLHQLRGAAPDARIVVLDYYNPFAAAALLGSRGEPLARRSDEAQAQLNTAIAEAAAAVGADLAGVGAAFSPAPGPGTSGTSPAAGLVCSWTWMCGQSPDIHATQAGYAVIAQEVLGALDLR